MRLNQLIALLLTCLLPVLVDAQTCTALGQNPGTAFPVCGTSTFIQNDVPICGNRSVPGPCSSDGLTDKNPYWYKFTCFTEGTLGFVITPNTLSDDYDWQLFDVTGKDVANVYTDASMVVTCNWSGEGGTTGASSAGRDLFVCAGYGKALFSSMVTLKKDHQYLLLVSHFTNTQSGYKLEFKGGTANITDPTAPAFKNAEAGCGGMDVRIKLNKKMRCQSLAADGSDFSINPALGNVIKATAAGCASGFDMDSVTLTIDRPLPPGSYAVVAKKGSDGNTILDNCNQGIPENNSVPFTVQPIEPTPMDSLTTVGCSPGTLSLVFRKPILCSSIAADGSDFVLSGPSGVRVTGATGGCSGPGSSRVITIQLSDPITTGGNYILQLKGGTDGNTLLDECGQQTPIGQSLPFETSDIVDATFSYSILPSCKTDQVRFSHAGGNGIDRWKWTFDNRIVSDQQNPSITYSTTGAHSVKLLVSNKLCRDSLLQELSLPAKIDARFSGPDLLCPQEVAVFADSSVGPVSSWTWDFGNGNFSTSSTPGGQNYPGNTREVKYPVVLVVRDGQGCSDTAKSTLTVVNSCVIAVPNAFTPNGDGINDFLFPSNAWKASNLIFRVYNRFGQVVFETRDWTKKWDGRFGSRLQDAGTYVWVLQYTAGDQARQVFLRGSTVLIR